MYVGYFVITICALFTPCSTIQLCEYIGTHKKYGLLSVLHFDLPILASS